MKRIISTLLLTALLFSGGIYPVQKQLDMKREAVEGDELMFLPNGTLIHYLALDHRGLMADLWWIRSLIYVRQHFWGDRKFIFLNHLYQIITDLDPHFLTAYTYGGIFLALIADKPNLAIELLEKGLKNNPNAWELPYDMGLYAYKRMNDPERAAQYYQIASQIPGSPDLLKGNVAMLLTRAGQRELALKKWQDMYDTATDESIRSMARFNINQTLMEEHMDLIEEAVAKYKTTTGSFPPDLDTLVREGYLVETPPDPFGSYYFLDHRTEKVKNAYIAREELIRNILIINGHIEKYREKNGKYPEKLQDVIDPEDLNGLKSIPSHSFPDMDFIYDKEKGRIKLNPELLTFPRTIEDASNFGAVS